MTERYGGSVAGPMAARCVVEHGFGSYSWLHHHMFLTWVSLYLINADLPHCIHMLQTVHTKCRWFAADCNCTGEERCRKSWHVNWIWVAFLLITLLDPNQFKFKAINPNLQIFGSFCNVTPPMWFPWCVRSYSFQPGMTHTLSFKINLRAFHVLRNAINGLKVYRYLWSWVYCCLRVLVIVYCNC